MYEDRMATFKAAFKPKNCHGKNKHDSLIKPSFSLNSEIFIFF